MNLLTELKKYLGSGGFIDIKPNTEKTIAFGNTFVTYTRLWGRCNISDDAALLAFDAPLPTFAGTKFLVPFSGTINAVTITSVEILAETSLGRHQIYP